MLNCVFSSLQGVEVHYYLCGTDIPSFLSCIMYINYELLLCVLIYKGLHSNNVLS